MSKFIHFLGTYNCENKMEWKWYLWKIHHIWSIVINCRLSENNANLNLRLKTDGQRHAFIAWFSSSIICTFHSSMKSRSSFTWSWVKNLIAEPGFDPQWKQVWTQPGMSCNLVKIHVNKSNPIRCGVIRNRLRSITQIWVWSWLSLTMIELIPDSCKHSFKYSLQK